MEEQKVKEIKMQPNIGKQGNTQNGQQKLSYDQLKDMADKLWNEVRYLRQQNQQLSSFANTINRLDYLFKIVEIANHDGKFAFDSDFVVDCILEIQKVMTPPEENSEEEKKN